MSLVRLCPFSSNNLGTYTKFSEKGNFISSFQKQNQDVDSQTNAPPILYRKYEFVKLRTLRAFAPYMPS